MTRIINYCLSSVLGGARTFRTPLMACLLIVIMLNSCFNIDADEEEDQLSERSSDYALTDAIVAEDVQFDSSLQGQRPPPGAVREFSTLFERSLVDFDEIISGGPPKDGIPALTDPDFVEVDDAQEWLKRNEMVFVADYREWGASEVRIYPVQILIYHEIVNDTIGPLPIIITYCPLCNTAAAFGRTIHGIPHQFGVSGRLRRSNLLMYDDLTESWWQQATGEAVVGEYTGSQLRSWPLLTLSWGEARKQYPEALVLSRQTGHNRPYGRNPYVGYDTLNHPFLYLGPRIDASYTPFTRVLVVRINNQEQGYQYPELQKNVVTHDSIGGQNIVIFWSEDSASPLDTQSVSEGRQVGSANAFLPIIEGRELNFFAENGIIYDERTKSTWSTNGRALSGSMAGSLLTAVPSIQHFWFSWSAFRAR